MSAHPVTKDVLGEIIDGFRALHRATAWVEFEKDPAIPGRTAYRISGQDRGAVQSAIDSRMQEAERAGGFANFVGPNRIDGGWAALGEVIIKTPAAVVAA